MPIQDIELFHGVALTKLLRKGPKAVRLVEFNPKNSSSAYKINLSNCYLFIKHSKTPQPNKDEDKYVWHF